MIKKASEAATLGILLLLLIQNCADDNRIRWQEKDGYRWAPLAVPGSGRTGFKLLPESETGITFVNNLTEDQIKTNRVLLNGSGVAIGDIDGDGLVDLYFCRLDGPNALYKNLGNWKFQDVTDSAGVACADQFSSGAALADIDGDADLDLLVTAVGGPNACFLNDGTGKFTEVTESAGISSNTGAATMALADIDGDADLDLYIANYKKVMAKDIFYIGELAYEHLVEHKGGEPRIAPKYQEHYTLKIADEMIWWLETGEPDMLLLNDGTGHFEQVSFTDGRFLNEDGDPVSELKDWGLMVRFQDIDNDGDPDIYVCNDFESPDRIWINDGDGHFQAIPKLAIRSTSNSSMAVDFSDLDRDGDQDFFVMDMLSRVHSRRMTQQNTMLPVPPAIGLIDNRPQYMRNTLFLNRGDNTYAEIAQLSNVQASEWSWSSLFFDVDLDGYEDVVVATGHYYDAQDLESLRESGRRVGIDRQMPFTSEFRSKIDKLNTIGLFPRLELRNVAFRNRGDLTFEEVSREWGVDAMDISHGMALGDLDNDGDLDIVMNRLQAPAAIYRNQTNAPRIAVRLRGLPPNTQGIGAKIRVVGGPVPQSKEVISAGVYLSSSDPLYVFATGEAETLSVAVEWRNGGVSTVRGVKPNRIYEIHELNTQVTDHSSDGSSSASTADPDPFFEDVSYLIQHEHHEDPFDDFIRQPLLPNRLSQLGPGIAWHDLDADGHDDLVITSGASGQLTYYKNMGGSGFAKETSPLLSQQGPDQTTVLGWTKEDGSTSLLVGVSNFENKEPGDSFVLRYDFRDGKVNLGEREAELASSIGPMTMADYDADGDLDLFVGGRSIPGRYPEPADSRLYRNQGGDFELDSLNSSALQELGLVSGAVFSDIDADGDADLILAVEWGPVKLYRNEGGRFSDATEELGLAGYHGWWHGVTTGDLDEDGKLDIIATNWGLNSKYQNRYDNEHPLQAFYADFDNNGTLDMVEAYYDDWTQRMVPDASFAALIRAMPVFAMRMPDSRKYSRSSVAEVIGPRLKRAGQLKANALAHTVFFNRGDKFEAVEMPIEAQFSPAFYVGVADFDGDGHEDVFLSQNFFALPVTTSRLDAGRGLWLRGDGTGRLSAVPGQESGIKVYGEQRGAALGDYDRDGRIDLVVSQNGAATKLYHNIGAQPGLRIRLLGPKGNPFAVGATIRLVYEDGYGPAREVHSGSGYWSQDSMVQVMGRAEKVKGVWVRWPGGHVTESDVPANASAIVVRSDGGVSVE